MTSPTNSKIVGRIQALLAKAESTEFPEEAEALFAKAQELMTRHSIDEVLARTRSSSDKPEMRKVKMEAPYASAKFTLISAVGRANDVQVIGDGNYLVTMFGYRTDLDAVEMLFASLVVQATRSMFQAGYELAGRRVRAFRHSFLIAFAHHIEQRLREAKQRAEDEVASEMGTALVPLLDAKRDAVAQLADEVFPNVQTKRVSMSHAGGYYAGRDAAERADLGGKGRLDGGSGRALAR
ncbi:MAG: DUF2786 domain-containing protein [Acidimicrobiales bacterium]|nr:DUF2786 domain-containing protein [Acidimicrobiales bacterium]